MQIQPVTLEGRFVRLEPLTVAHTDAIARASADPRIWEFSSAIIASADDVPRYIETALEWQRAGTAVPFATVDRASGEVIGSTRFANIDRQHRRAEIGWTWLNPAWWRTPVNTEAKYLMLRHAFEQWGCIRVELKTALRNQRSRTAILRLGAKEEGVLRRHMIQPDGSYRDTVYFSILDDEWPATRARLETLLSRPRAASAGAT